MSTTIRTDPVHRSPATRTDRVRQVAGVVAVAAAVPYLTMKLLWLTGHPVGLVDTSLARDGSMGALNTLTALLDLVALLLAVVFARGVGHRTPAWLVALPMWVGTGLLAPIVTAAPLVALITAVTSADATVGDGPVRPWVYAMVYTGFTVEGIALLVAFRYYARDRWPAVLAGRVGDRAPGSTRPLQVLAANAGAGAAVAVAGLRLAWAAGAAAGQPARLLAGRDATTAVVDAVFALFALVAAGGVLALVHRPRPAGHRWPPVVATWVGAGALFAWGGWAMIVLLAGPAPATDAGAVPALAGLVMLLTGLMMAVAGTCDLLERSAPPPTGAAPPTGPEPAAPPQTGAAPPTGPEPAAPPQTGPEPAVAIGD